MIEIKPTRPHGTNTAGLDASSRSTSTPSNVLSIKEESSLGGSDELHALESNLALDPSLNELAMHVFHGSVRALDQILIYSNINSAICQLCSMNQFSCVILVILIAAGLVQCLAVKV